MQILMPRINNMSTARTCRKKQKHCGRWQVSVKTNKTLVCDSELEAARWSQHLLQFFFFPIITPFKEIEFAKSAGKHSIFPVATESHTQRPIFHQPLLPDVFNEHT